MLSDGLVTVEAEEGAFNVLTGHFWGGNMAEEAGFSVLTGDFGRGDHLGEVGFSIVSKYPAWLPDPVVGLLLDTLLEFGYLVLLDPSFVFGPPTIKLCSGILSVLLFLFMPIFSLWVFIIV